MGNKQLTRTKLIQNIFYDDIVKIINEYLFEINITYVQRLYFSKKLKRLTKIRFTKKKFLHDFCVNNDTIYTATRDNDNFVITEYNLDTKESNIIMSNPHIDWFIKS